MSDPKKPENDDTRTGRHTAPEAEPAAKHETQEVKATTSEPEQPDDGDDGSETKTR